MDFKKLALITLLIPGVISACHWCDEWKIKDSKELIISEDIEDPISIEEEKPEPMPLPTFDEPEEESFEDLMKKLTALMSGDDDAFSGFDDFASDSGFTIDANSIELSPEVGDAFYKTYLQKYFPRALVIVDNFSLMCPIAIEAALDEVVSMMTHNPWFYFKNKKQGFKLGHYWEIILDQYDTITDFLSRAYVSNNGEVFLKDKYDFSSNIKGISLIKYWKDCGVDSFYKFHAHHCDYLIKMFNEGIQTEDYGVSRHYYGELQTTVKRLQNSRYESEYQESLKNAKWLLSELKSRLDIDSDFMDDGQFDYLSSLLGI